MWLKASNVLGGNFVVWYAQLCPSFCFQCQWTCLTMWAPWSATLWWALLCFLGSMTVWSHHSSALSSAR